jgi:hypothetical protein
MPVKPWVKFNQFPLPKSPLPPLQIRYQKQPTERGKKNTGYVLAQAQRGKPFSGSWNVGLNYPFFTFGASGTYPRPDCNWQTFQRIVNAADPLRTYNMIFNPKTKFRP